MHHHPPPLDHRRQICSGLIVPKYALIALMLNQTRTVLEKINLLDNVHVGQGRGLELAKPTFS